MLKILRFVYKILKKYYKKNVRHLFEHQKNVFSFKMIQYYIMYKLIPNTLILNIYKYNLNILVIFIGQFLRNVKNIYHKPIWCHGFVRSFLLCIYNIFIYLTLPFFNSYRVIFGFFSRNVQLFTNIGYSLCSIFITRSE